jgi:hypothetical protein
MSSSDSRWAELSSQNERIIPADQGLTVDLSTAARPQWAELASQSERLVEVSDPLFRLASPDQARTGMRLVASAA